MPSLRSIVICHSQGAHNDLTSIAEIIKVIQAWPLYARTLFLGHGSFMFTPSSSKWSSPIGGSKLVLEQVTCGILRNELHCCKTFQGLVFVLNQRAAQSSLNLKARPTQADQETYELRAASAAPMNRLRFPVSGRPIRPIPIPQTEPNSERIPKSTTLLKELVSDSTVRISATHHWAQERNFLVTLFVVTIGSTSGVVWLRPRLKQ